MVVVVVAPGSQGDADVRQRAEERLIEHPVTNADTESLNSLIRVMNRLGRGYSFEALRAKILFTEGIHSNKQIHVYVEPN